MNDVTVSIITCTRNPNLDLIQQAVASVSKQTVAPTEYLLIDNCSNVPIKETDLEAKISVKIIQETKPGLMNAMVCGMSRAASDLIIFVDDDNLLQDNYIEEAIKFHIETGSKIFTGNTIYAGSKKVPRRFYKLLVMLGCRTSNENVVSQRGDRWHFLEPIGAGLVLHKDVCQKVLTNPLLRKAQLRGRGDHYLPRGGDDTFIVRVADLNGFRWSFAKNLFLEHVIDRKRVSFKYLVRLSAGYGFSRVELEALLLELNELNERNIKSNFKVDYLIKLLPFRVLKHGLSAGFIYWVGDVTDYLARKKLSGRMGENV